MKYFFFSCLLTICLPVFSQDKMLVIQQGVEYFMERNQTEDADVTLLTEQFIFLLEHPLNLNEATLEDLESLQLLNSIQINSFMHHRKMVGDLLTIYELQAIAYWDVELIELILPFVVVKDKFATPILYPKELIRYGSYEFVSRISSCLDNKVGFDSVADSVKLSSSKYYLGDPFRLFTRFRYMYLNNVSVGFTAEKDPGEQFFKGNQKKGFDFYSGHLFYKGGSFVKTVALGDYHIQLGQGLNCWTSYAFGKTIDATQVKKNGVLIRPHTSSDEIRFFRGAALELSHKKIHLLTFTSFRNKDGTLGGDSIQPIILSMGSSGYHRTTSENAHYHTYRESILGGSFRIEHDQFKLGLNHITTHYSIPYLPVQKPYNKFDVTGAFFQSTSIDYSYVFKNTLFFGELSTLGSKDKCALIQGFTMAVDNNTSLSIVYRRYSKSYETNYNVGFSDNNKTQNEEGIYLGINHSFTRKLALQGYVDFFKSFWLTYSYDQPFSGSEQFIQCTFKPTKKTELYLRFRNINKPISISEDLSILQPTQQKNLRFHLQYALFEKMIFKSRVEYITIQSREKESGVLVMQDIAYNPPNSKWSLTARCAVFQTDSYASRIYSFESNPLYVYGNPSYFDKGVRMYALCQFKLFKDIDLWFRYGGFYYTALNVIGSGSDQIMGNKKREWVFQVRWKIN